MAFISKLTLSKKLYYGFGVVILLMIGIFSYTYVNYEKETKAVDINLTTYEVMREADGILTSMLNMETGARGYALAGKPDFLEPFYQGQQDFNKHFSKIKLLTAGDTAQQKRLELLLARYQNWYDWETGQIIAGRSSVNAGEGKMEDVIALVQTDKGKNEMDGIRSLLDQIIGEEQALLDVRNASLQIAEERTGLVMTLGGFLTTIVAIAIAIIAALSVSRPVKMLIRSTENIIAQNYQQPIRLKADKELAVLINNFNTMQSTIQSREDELEKKNEALRTKMAEANEANRLKSQFLANMSHELRTPLNSIIGFTTRVLKKSGNDLPLVQKENLTIVKDEAYHLLDLINSLLDYSKMEAGKMEVHTEAFDMLKVIDEVGVMMKSLAEGKPIQYRQVLCSTDSIPIITDRIKFKQILINLLSNALKYSDKGTVTLAVDREQTQYRIRVEDEGVGISPENIRSIFDEFRQVDGSYTRKVGGTGLGLSITKKFIEMLGGHIEVESQLGVGSRFTVYLPIEPAQENDAAAIEAPQAQYAKKVVCVDDDANVQKLYKQYLSEHNLEAIALDGTGDVIQEIVGIRPDVVLLDIMLPNKDGWEILAELKSNPQTKTLPIIMASVLSEKNLAYRMKADEYLIKPVSQEELFETIHRTITKREGMEVLIADDDENFVNLMGQFLSEESIAYRIARDGEEAIRQLINSRPSVLILDIMMPKKDGFAVMEYIKGIEELNETKIIVVTAKDLSKDEKEALSDRASMVIQKSGSLIENVMQVLLQKIKENVK